MKVLIGLKDEAKSFVHNATVLLLVVLAVIVLYAAFIFAANNWPIIAGWCLVAADSLWSFLKSIPGWLWIALAILMSGWMIAAALAEIAARLPEPPDDDDEMIVP